MIKALFDEVLHIFEGYIAEAPATVVEIVVDSVFGDVFREKALEGLHLLLNDAVEVDLHGLDERGLILLVEYVDAVGQLPLDGVHELGHGRVFFGNHVLMLPQCMRLQKERGDAHGKRAAVGIHLVDHLLITHLQVFLEKTVAVQFSQVYEHVTRTLLCEFVSRDI